MSKIVSIGVALPDHRHSQQEILSFMQAVYALPETEKRKLRFLYHQSGIDWRYSVIPDYTLPAGQWKFYPQSENLEPFPSLEQRMEWFNKEAGPLSAKAIYDCLGDKKAEDITHLITVSCTGMSAPGLDLHLLELLSLPGDIYRTSVNFMGCYAAIHALKMADSICIATPSARVMIVCTELCTLHFQREARLDNISSALLFGDGAAAVMVTGDDERSHGLRLIGFYSEVISKGKNDMAWELSSSGFLMTLSGFIPDLIEEDFAPLVSRALLKMNSSRNKINRWCIHPGGKRILEVIHRSLGFANGELDEAYDVLRNYGNMSSATILFVLKKMMEEKTAAPGNIFGAAFGPGLTMETFIAEPV